MTCGQWLAALLGGQKFMNCEVIRVMAKEAGYSKGQLSKARKECGVTTVNDMTAQKDNIAKNWFWLIPKEDTENAGISD